MPKRYSQNHTFRITFLTLTLVILLLLLAGCSGPGRIPNNEKPATPLPTKVPPAPQQLYMKAGQYENFSYWGHTIAVNYSSAYPTQKIKVTVDGSEKVLQKELTDSPNGIDWNDGNLSFTLKPVVWEKRDNQDIPIYESTWNTTEVYFIARILAPTSDVSGGPKI